MLLGEVLRKIPKTLVIPPVFLKVTCGMLVEHIESQTTFIAVETDNWNILFVNPDGYLEWPNHLGVPLKFCETGNEGVEACVYLDAKKWRLL